MICLLFLLPLVASMSLMPNQERPQADGLAMNKGDRRVFELPQPEATKVAELLLAKNISFLIHLLQNKHTHGTLFSIYDGASRRVLELYSDGKSTGRILVNARAWNGDLRTYPARKNIADGEWHKVILELNAESLDLVVDCNKLLRVDILDLDLSRLARGQARVFIGQRNNLEAQFVGSLREFTADSGTVREQQCPSLTDNTDARSSTAYPHIGVTPEPLLPKPVRQRADNVVQDVDYLKHKVGYLENQFKHWRKVVQRYENQLKHVQLHQRGCQVGDLIIDDGETWANDSNCTECVCSLGQQYCKPIGCRPVDCSHPLLREDNCCPVCGDSCYYMGQTYEHGHHFWPKACVRCRCFDGLMDCSYQQADNCPTLDCPSSKQQTPDGQCCAVCVGDDFCAKSPCHQNATCVNEKYGRQCRCTDGFFGNGEECYDVDECLWDESARQQLGGCGPGTRCINTAGSFKCECLPGYAKLDERTCLDIIIP